LVGVFQPASDELRLSSVRRRRDVEWRRRSRRIQRDRDKCDRINGIDFDIDIDRLNNDDLKPDERLDDDGIDIKQYLVY
jgi:hypothetical protein